MNALISGNISGFKKVLLEIEELDPNHLDENLNKLAKMIYVYIALYEDVGKGILPPKMDVDNIEQKPKEFFTSIFGEEISYDIAKKVMIYITKAFAEFYNEDLFKIMNKKDESLIDKENIN